MSLPRIIERTFYPPLAEYARSIGFEAIGESGIGEGAFSDLLVKIKGVSFVVEVKLGKPTATLSLGAMAQAARYAQRYDTKNYMVLIFPEAYRNQPITSGEMLERLALREKVTCLVFSDYWTEHLQETPEKIFSNLRQLIEGDKRKIDFNTVVEQIKEFVIELNSITYQLKNDELVSEVVEKLDLFTAIGELKDKEAARNQITNLSSYLLFNQLLFYHVYQKLSKNNKLLELDEITNIKDIQKYFDAITDIDYKSIYRPNILSHIPNEKSVINILNDVIGAIKLLRAEYITHDLAGRFFHDLIPFEVRKILAAFYTHPNSADLLSGLTIDSAEETVIDPSCGSGTLLVSSYQTKLRAHQNMHGYTDLKKIHRRFLEKDISGIDIMPFASHITTINLAMQDIEQQTNLVRIASLDSLELAKQLKSKSFVKGKGFKISGFEKSIQHTLTGAQILTKKQGSVSMQGKGSEFYLTPSDIVIMNPPFSDREKMPKEMRDKINGNEILNKTCGGQVNLWGLFLVLSDLLLKKGGKIGTVIPINIARGEATQDIRSFMLKNYTAKFIIKPLIDDAFSEGASFKDILYIAQKKKPDENDYTGIVSIRVSIKNLQQTEVLELVKQLSDCYENKTDKQTTEFEITFIKTLDLLNYEQNLMPLIGFSTQKNRRVLENFLDTIKKKSRKQLIKINSELVSEGFHASPSGLSELVFVTRHTDDARIERAFMILKKEKNNSIEAQIKNSEIILEIPVSKVKPALRTLTGIKSFNAENVDYILTEQPAEFSKILSFSKWKGDFNWFEHKKNVEKKMSFVVVGRRFRPNSKNTHLFAFYSKNKLLSPHTFKNLNFENAKEALVQTLILNSSITIANILSFREQTTGGFTDIMESELRSFDVFNFSQLTKAQTAELEMLFQKLKSEQYENNNKDRRLLDSIILEVLGFNKQEIEHLLDKLYPAIVEELKIKG